MTISIRVREPNNKFAELSLPFIWYRFSPFIGHSIQWQWSGWMTDNGQAASYYVTSSWRSVLQNERKSDSCVIRFIFLVVVLFLLSCWIVLGFAKMRLLFEYKRWNRKHLPCIVQLMNASCWNCIADFIIILILRVHICTFVGSGLNVKHRWMLPYQISNEVHVLVN